MSWVEKRIKRYKEGENPTFLEKMALEHGNPVNCVLSLFAFGSLGYGLWTHDFLYIIVGALLGFTGHVYCWLQKEEN